MLRIAVPFGPGPAALVFRRTQMSKAVVGTFVTHRSSAGGMARVILPRTFSAACLAAPDRALCREAFRSWCGLELRSSVLEVPRLFQDHF